MGGGWNNNRLPRSKSYRDLISMTPPMLFVPYMVVASAEGKNRISFTEFIDILSNGSRPPINITFIYIDGSIHFLRSQFGRAISLASFAVRSIARSLISSWDIKFFDFIGFRTAPFEVHPATKITIQRIKSIFKFSCFFNRFIKECKAVRQKK